MSDEGKKNNKHLFFRVNSKGELTATEKTVAEKSPRGPEPEQPTSIQSPTFANTPTEVRPKDSIEPQQKLEMDLPISESEEEAPVSSSNDELAPQLESPQDTAFHLEPSSFSDSFSEDFEPKLDSEPEEESEKIISPNSHLDQDNLTTLKNYIALKEKEVADLRDQQKQYQTVLLKLKRTHSELTHTNLELQQELETAKSSEQQIKKEMSHLREKFETDIAILKNDYEQQQRQNGSFQEQLQDLNRQKTAWKETIAEDLKKIKIKERELENRYELLKQDTETLLDSKDQQILELRKKTDAFELELESLEERLRSEHAVLNSIDSKKRRLIETLKLAISLLEQIDSNPASGDERKTG